MKFIKYDFSMPPLDKPVYDRLNIWIEKTGIKRRGLVTIGLTLLFDVLEGKDDCKEAIKALSRIQEETGIHRPRT